MSIPFRYAYQPGDKDEFVIRLRAGAPDPKDRGLNRRDVPDVVVPPSIAHGLTRAPGSVIQAFYTLHGWRVANEDVTVERYLSHVEDPAAGDEALRMLADMGLLIGPEEAEERERDFAERCTGSRWLPTDTDDRYVPKEKPGPRGPRRTYLDPPVPAPAFLKRRWRGTLEDLAETCPRPKVCVVYRLFDEDGKLLYIGSTGNVYTRLGRHPIKGWTRWDARECADRESAYWLEAVAIIREKPPLNGNESVGGRIPALRAKRRA